jgi:hypothetical protein
MFTITAHYKTVCKYNRLRMVIFILLRFRLHVYYGLELLEVVSADRNDPSFKMLVHRIGHFVANGLPSV